MRAYRKTANREVVVEQVCTEPAKHTDLIAQREGEQHEFKHKLDISERFNNAADFWYSLLSDSCVLLRGQIVTGRVCSEEMVEILANAFRDVEAMLYDFKCHAAYAQKAV